MFLDFFIITRNLLANQDLYLDLIDYITLSRRNNKLDIG